MLYKIRKVTRKNCYRVKNGITKHVYSICTQKDKAQRQVNLLRALRYNKKFQKRGTKKNNTIVT